MSARLSAIAYTVGTTPFQVHVCQITGQLRVTSPTLNGYAPIGSEGHRIGKLVWDGANGALNVKAKKGKA